MHDRTIAVVGLGYIGLPTAAVFASSGCNVIGIDVDADVVNTINAGRIHIVEPSLADLVKSAVEAGRLRASTAAEAADAFLIAVPTPFKGAHEPDLQYVAAAVRSIAPHLRRGNTVILESTSPVGATERVAAWLAEARPDLCFPTAEADGPADVHIAYCPERVLPGNIIAELVTNDRVIGGMTPRCSEAAAEIYRAFVKSDCIFTTARTAEMCKLAENSFRDVNIAFANELSMICDEQSIDVWDLIALANRHPRVNILQPGPGVGGHCIAVDPWFIVCSNPDMARLIRTAREVNDYKPTWVIDKVHEAADRIGAARPSGPPVTIACLGLAFKPNVDDLRESPSVKICSQLAASSLYRVLAVEPHIRTLPTALLGNAELVDLATAVRDADIILLLVDHAEFCELKPSSLGSAIVIDTRGAWRKPRLRSVSTRQQTTETRALAGLASQ